MKRFILAALLVLVPVLSHADDRALRGEVDAKVTQLAAMLGDSHSAASPEYRGIRTMTDRDGTTVAVAVFTVEGFGGGNNHIQYMAVFASLDAEAAGRQPRMSLIDVMAVGGKGIRAVESGNIKIGRSKSDVVVAVPTKNYAPSDAMCCPSIKSEAQFAFQPFAGSRLKEIAKRQR